MLVVEAGEPLAGQAFVAPDNGLLDPFLAGARAVRAADRPDLYRAGPGATFHGRDRFAPLAAALLAGETPAALGPEITDPVRLPRLPAARGGRPPRPGRPRRPLRQPGDGHPERLAGRGSGGAGGRPAALRAEIGGMRPPSAPATTASCRRARPRAPRVDRHPRAGARRRKSCKTVGRRTRCAGPRRHRRRRFPPAGRAGRAAPQPLNPSGYNGMAGEGAGRSGTMTQWEYKIINIRSENYRLDPNPRHSSTSSGRMGGNSLDHLGQLQDRRDGQHRDGLQAAGRRTRRRLTAGRQPFAIRCKRRSRATRRREMGFRPQRRTRLRFRRPGTPLKARAKPAAPASRASAM